LAGKDAIVRILPAVILGFSKRLPFPGEHLADVLLNERVNEAIERTLMNERE
jgi:hypothetical protein